MNDDLNLLIMFISHDMTLVKVAVSIEHGMNSDLGRGNNYQYFKEKDIFLLLLGAVPQHVRNDIDYIVGVEELYWIGQGVEDVKN